MKRHHSLAYLSREHHGALILAKLLQKNAPAYKGLPADIPGKAIYAWQYYNDELIRHFKNEERALQLSIGVTEALDLMIQTIFSEHEHLHSMFMEMANNPAMADQLDSIGKALETHIRKEERELFPMIEEECSENILAAIESYLSSH